MSLLRYTFFLLNQWHNVAKLHLNNFCLLLQAAVVKPAPKKAAKVVEKKAKSVEEPLKEEPFDPIADKLRMQRYCHTCILASSVGSTVPIRNILSLLFFRLVEEADYQATAELFGAKTEKLHFGSCSYLGECDSEEI